MHKTGTTAIQGALDRDRAWLAANGVAYPQLFAPRERPREAHHSFSKALVTATSLSDPGVQHFRRQIEEAADGARLTVLSAEPIFRLMLHGHPDKQGTILQWPRIMVQRLRRALSDPDAFFEPHRAYLMRLRRLLDEFDVSVLLYLRRPDKVAESMFKTATVAGGKAYGFSTRLRWIDWYFDYPRHLDMYADIFDHLEVRCYEAEAKGDLIAGFYAALGLEQPPVKETDKVRLSLGNRATLWLREAKVKAPADGTHWCRALFAAENRDSPLFAEDEPSTLWPSDKAFAAFVERHRTTYEMGYFDRPDPPGRPTTRWTEEMHRAAEAAFAAWLRDNKERLNRRVAARLTKYWEPDPA